MPFFKANPERENSTHMDEAPVTRKKSIFSSKSLSQSPPPDQSNASTTKSSSFFRRRSSSKSSSDSESRSKNRGGFLGMGRSNRIADDPSIRVAREKVADAENAEKEADHALTEARERVKLASSHVQGLEREAFEEAKRAKAKHAEAKIVKESAKHLGRHGN